ncbi:MAG: aminotransferase class III-fold pyridoxal phosphate-dependent enzyme [Bacteroidia bacterium]|jgi:glutamate-1-semialdehyde aminotransferase
MANTVNLNQDYPTISASLKLYEQARAIMPPVTQTMAKGPGQYSLGAAPIYLKRGKGARVWDVDGNEYLDWNAAIGPLSLGYGWPAVDQAIINQLGDGITFSLMHELEYRVAERLHKIIPNAESIRISKSGADVCSAAVRIARAHTGREKILCCGYHGWHDWYIAVTSRANGIPSSVGALTNTFDYNNIDSLKESLDSSVAAVIMEPFVFDRPAEGYLHEVARLCKENGTLLIFDEMWSGFRLALGGAQEYFGLKPDLAVYSKAVANGMPIAFLTGRRDVMEHFNTDVFFFTTFGGEALSLAATLATLDELERLNVPADLANKGKVLMDGYNALAESLGMQHLTKCKGFPCRTTVTLEAGVGNALEVKAYFQQEMIRRGVLWQGNHNMMAAHSMEDIDYTLKAYADVLPLVKDAIEKGDVAARLRGKPLEAVFRKVDNFNMKPKA